LNNTGDTVRLLNPLGASVATVSYAGSAEGQSYNRTTTESSALSTTLTPGAPNIITQASDDEEDDEVSASAQPAYAKASAGKSAKPGSVKGTSAVRVKLADVREEEVGARRFCTSLAAAFRFISTTKHGRL
jgi:hypothetical protein